MNLIYDFRTGVKYRRHLPDYLMDSGQPIAGHRSALTQEKHDRAGPDERNLGQALGHPHPSLRGTEINSVFAIVLAAGLECVVHDIRPHINRLGRACHRQGWPAALMECSSVRLRTLISILRLSLTSPVWAPSVSRSPGIIS